MGETTQPLAGAGQPKPFMIYLLGYPAVGKYTIACELARRTDAIVVDNQLINRPILGLFHWDGKTQLPAGTLTRANPIREAVLSAMEEIAPPEQSYILTNVLAEEDRWLYERVKQVATRRKACFLPVLLRCREEEQLRRVGNPDRLDRYKMADGERLLHLMDNTLLLVPDERHLLKLDTTELAPADAAQQILEKLAAL
jgi:hypothetical protein